MESERLEQIAKEAVSVVENEDETEMIDPSNCNQYNNYLNGGLAMNRSDYNKNN